MATMKRKKPSWTEEKIQRRMKDGYGSGKGDKYRGWRDGSDHPDEPSLFTPHTWKAQDRSHDLIGDLDIALFHCLQWNDNVIEIQEYFPLQRERTLDLAEELNIAHKKDAKTKVPIVKVANFLVTYNRSWTEEKATLITSWSDELSKQAINQFEIQRRYWAEKGIPIQIVTEKQINMNVARNMYKLMHMKYGGRFIIDKEWCDYTLEELAEHQKHNPRQSIYDFSQAAGTKEGTTPGNIATHIEYLVANHVLDFDWKQKEFNKNLPISDLQIVERPFRIEKQKDKSIFERYVLLFID